MDLLNRCCGAQASCSLQHPHNDTENLSVNKILVVHSELALHCRWDHGALLLVLLNSCQPVFSFSFVHIYDVQKFNSCRSTDRSNYLIGRCKKTLLFPDEDRIYICSSLSRSILPLSIFMGILHAAHFLFFIHAFWKLKDRQVKLFLFLYSPFHNSFFFCFSTWIQLRAPLI